MIVSLECKKVKRSGFLPFFFGGGILAAAVPVINMAVRSEMYLNLAGNPIQILLDANWQMMAITFCTCHWFEIEKGFWGELL